MVACYTGYGKHVLGQELYFSIKLLYLGTPFQVATNNSIEVESGDLSLFCCVAETSVYTNTLHKCIVLLNVTKRHNAILWDVCVNASFAYTAVVPKI